DEQVPLRGKARARDAAGPGQALGARVRGAPPGRVDDADLALLPTRVGGREPADDLVRRRAVAEQREPGGAVARVRGRLRRDRARLRLGPGDDRADGQELRLRRDPPLAALEVAGGDR